MNNPDKYFRDKLYDLETPLNDRLSFEGVMARRKAGRKVFWWKPTLAIIAGLFAVTGAAYLWFGNHDADGSGISDNKNKKAAIASGKQQGVNLQSPGQNAKPADPDPADEKSTDFVQSSKNESAEYSGSNRIQNTRSGAGMVRPVTGGYQIISGNNADKAVTQDAPASPETFAPAWLARLFGRKPAIQPIGYAAGDLARLNISINPYEAYRDPALPLYVELMAITGGNGYRNFDENADLSIRGNHHFSQYHAILLTDIGRGMLAGAGLSYQACMGVAQVRKAEYAERMVVDSHTVVIIQPGLPPRNVVVRDTSFVTDRRTVGTDISYRMNKVSVPLAFRYQLGQGRGIIRLSATLAPGIVTMQAGTMFNRSEMTRMENVRSHALTLDARIGAGMYYQMSRNVAIVAEPVLQWQTAAGKAWKPFNRLGAGFGLGVVFRP